MNYMSLGSNCCIAQSLKKLGIREPSPFDWADHISIEDIIYLKENQQCIAYFLRKHQNNYIHEDLNDMQQTLKIGNRLFKFFNWNGDFMYLLEKSHELSYQYLLSFRKLCNSNTQKIYIIISNSSYNEETLDIDSLKEHNIIIANDSELIMDSCNLDNPKIVNFVNNMLKENYEEISFVNSYCINAN